MKTRSKLLLAALTAALVLGALTSTASARRFTISNQNFRAVWRSGFELMKFIGEALGIQIGCAVTLEGSFHSRTISKVSGQLIGVVTRAALARPCEGGGEAWILNGTEVQGTQTLPSTLPWHIRYDSFTGALPNITNIRVQIIGASVLIFFSLSRCLYRSTAARPAFGQIEIVEGFATNLRLEMNAQIPLQETQSGICEPNGRLTHAGAITLLGTTTLITVSLVQ